MDTIPVLLLLQVPPGDASESVAVPPIHMDVRPVMAPGALLTEIAVETGAQPGVVYDMVHEPGDTPYTEPVDGLTVATETDVLAHDPPGNELPRVTELPKQTPPGPVIPLGGA
jgi:hypothetical protein